MSILVAVLTLCAVSVQARAPTSPKQGSVLRKALLEALSRTVENDLKKRVVFQVDHMKVLGKWAFMTGKPRLASGGKIDYRKTKYRSAVEAGVFDDWICAIFEKKGSKWTVAQFAIGATDVVWDGWDKQFKAPRAIFPYGK